MNTRQDHFLSHIANRLGRPRVTTKPQHPFRGAPDFWEDYELDAEQRVELFMQNWNGLGGVAKRFSKMEEIAAYIEEVAVTMQAQYLIRWDHERLAELQLEERMPGVEIKVWNPEHENGQDREQGHEYEKGHAQEQPQALISKAAGADIGIAAVDYAIAHTGTVVAVSGATKGRAVSLLPTAFMAIVRAEDIKTRMGEVMQALHEQYGTDLPAGVHFITGPSRSADIENDLTIGVHGPGIVYALIIG